MSNTQHNDTTPIGISMVQSTLNLHPLASWTGNSLSIDSRISDQDLLSIGSRLGIVEGVMSWAWADYLLALYRRFCDKDNDASASAKNQAHLSTEEDGHDAWLIDYCDQHGIDSKRRKKALGLALFFPAALRTIPLGYEYYREAYYAPGANSAKGRDKALGWLATAHAHGLTLAKFRKYLRQQTRATTGEQTAHPEIRDYAALITANRYARTQLVELRNGRITTETATQILHDLEDVEKFLEALREMVNGND